MVAEGKISAQSYQDGGWKENAHVCVRVCVCTYVYMFILACKWPGSMWESKRTHMKPGLLVHT